MKDRRIPIENIYYLLCYAWKHIDEQDVVGLGELAGIANVHDLLAKVLAQGTFKLVRRGIDRGYLEVAENLPSIRGKINVSKTVKQSLRVRSQVACEYEELLVDVLHNQILRSTLKSLLRIPEMDRSIHSEVRRAYDKLNGISELRLENKHFQQVHLDRNRRYYRFLMSICRLIFEQLIVDETSGQNQFADFSDKKMWQLFEDFVIGFYAEEQSEFRVNNQGRKVEWNDSGTSDYGRSMLPSMEADVLLNSNSRRIVLDVKYYQNALKSHAYGSPKLSSENLYQLLAYLRNREATTASEEPKLDGILLYPTVDQPISVDVTLEGFRIQAKSINLAQDWQGIHRDMLSILA